MYCAKKLFVIIVPEGSPRNCTATMIRSRFVTLVWNEPEAILQNGAITFYSFECSNDRQNLTLMSEMTSITLTSLRPYTLYWCSVAAVNSVGLGPSVSCSVFRTETEGKLCVCIII